MEAICKAHYKSPIGVIVITGNEEGIHSLSFTQTNPQSYMEENLEESSDADKIGNVPESIKDCLKQLDEYFKGTRKEFSVKYIVEGTPFQQKVWKSLTDIPFGQTISYAELAVWVGNKKAVRAVGGANSKNKLPIIIPCHRVIGRDGSLTGYACELWRKKWLLEHEMKYIGKVQL